MKAVLLVVLCVMMSVAAFGQDKNTHTVSLSIEGMTCGSCASKVDKALKGVEGVKDVAVSVEDKSATIVLAQNTAVSADNLAKVVTEAGYKASVKKSEGKTVKNEVKVEKKMEKEDGCCGTGSSCETEKKEGEKEVKKKKD
ncbi:MAG: hypothetical protein FJ215_02940 [Ignavibacteria bacterium]|nr:hypothetical protein [Ignavibacteria bacterium]